MLLTITAKIEKEDSIKNKISAYQKTPLRELEGRPQNRKIYL